MRILIITPAAVNSRNGNRTTAVRWKNMLQSLNHQVEIAQSFDRQQADVMIALHAWRSANSIQDFSEKHPGRPLIVALTGTDVYRFLNSHPEQTRKSLYLADRLIALHAGIHHSLPSDVHQKIRVIYQSSAVKLLRRKTPPLHFAVCIAGHLREEKDPLRGAWAARLLPTHSRIHISHFGKAHNAKWAHEARAETARNRRYRWYGEVSQAQLQFAMSRSHLLVLSSIMEGGANIISEAISTHLPVISSDIEGSIGLLGKTYPGYFNTQDSVSLRDLLSSCETSKTFYAHLKMLCSQRRPLFSPASERDRLKKLLEEFS